ncbi:MAG: hypothetical protein KME28_01215 [Pelatocladus maniniholoensis HA4357-MV3]|uniref:Uncharacterized protein n=1 Tax=Pelatocladus maniniholoensis HA4357-MV3 TaxID=1117104 RepID=A0A9E3H486_9NOST|nr:hypothetical protein [Pelatocladus maniniholoensis HA4357-MV3]
MATLSPRRNRDFSHSWQSRGVPVALGFVTIPSGPESSKIRRLMETRGDRTTDLRQAQFSENPRLADVPRHFQCHLATNLEGRSPDLDFSP